MKKILIILFLCGFIVSIGYVSETYNNGMPKVIKEYNTASKLYLSKETGYYPDGTKKYEDKYYKGKLTSSYRWDSKGKKITENKNSLDWTQARKSELISDCLKGGAPSREVCECVVESVVEVFTYKEFKSIEDLGQSDLTEEQQKKAQLIFESAVKCSE
tara:strand:+ start:76 stop:552 length:477 start_codon:yes stop_codon:yes gene_type:complete